MLDNAGAESLSRANKRHKATKHATQQQPPPHQPQQQQQQQQPAGSWQSEDSATDSGSSDAEGPRSKEDNDSDDSELHWPRDRTSRSLRYLRTQLLITVLRHSRLDFALTVRYVIIVGAKLSRSCADSMFLVSRSGNRTFRDSTFAYTVLPCTV